MSLSLVVHGSIGKYYMHQSDKRIGLQELLLDIIWFSSVVKIPKWNKIGTTTAKRKWIQSIEILSWCVRLWFWRTNHPRQREEHHHGECGQRKGTTHLQPSMNRNYVDTAVEWPEILRPLSSYTKCFTKEG